MTCYDLRQSVMVLKAHNCREMVHFIASCGRAYRKKGNTSQVGQAGLWDKKIKGHI